MSENNTEYPNRFAPGVEKECWEVDEEGLERKRTENSC